MTQRAWASNCTSTVDAPNPTDLLLRVQRDEDTGTYVVSDLTHGTNYGHGDTLEEALADYVSAVRDWLDVLRADRLSERLAREVAAYDAFLGTETP